VRAWYARLAGQPSLAALNALAEEAGVRTASGRPVRFVAPAADDAYYEIRLFETGNVQTRPESLHDLFNALAWLAFPRTKARINAMHAAQIPRERGVRGRMRDLLTIFDEGGAIVCAPPHLVELVRNFRWKDLFWERREETARSMKIHVLGHAILEQALQPRPGITCKAIFAEAPTDAAEGADACAAAWLAALPPHATPRDMAPLPIFGYPGWLPDTARAEFYDDERYFRPFRRELPR
jgi:hypothetical protein